MNGKKCTCEEDLAVLERVLEELLTTMEAIEQRTGIWIKPAIFIRRLAPASEGAMA